MVDNRALLATAKEPSHQQDVDLAQAKIRADLASGRRSLFKPAPPQPARSQDVLEERVAEEIELIVRQLGQVGDVLSDDPILLQRHSAQLQLIDIMQQKMRHLASVIASSEKAMAVERITLVNLKKRLTQGAPATTLINASAAYDPTAEIQGCL